MLQSEFFPDVLNASNTLKFEDVSSSWEVWSTVVKRYNYFPNRYTTLPCDSTNEIDSLCTQKWIKSKSIMKQIKEGSQGKLGKKMEILRKRIS